MQAKQSSTASGMYSCTGTFTSPPLPGPVPVACGPIPAPLASTETASTADTSVDAPDRRDLLPMRDLGAGSNHEAIQPAGEEKGVAQSVGLLHDALNLMGALGLYCDMLAVPGVLRPEHLHYAEELRLLAERSGTLIDRMRPSALRAPRPSGESGPFGELAKPRTAASSTAPNAPALNDLGASCFLPGTPVSLRAIVERCSGLLSRVAGGRTIDVSYGVAASMPVSVSEEAVERILVNLVRNSAAALANRPAAARLGEQDPKDTKIGGIRGIVRERVIDPTEDETHDTIRIGVGLLRSKVGDQAPWPFLGVRLTVEDSGCGMAPEQIEQILGLDEKTPATRGIGLRVVQELVAASRGEFRMMSAPGVGTRAQIEWPAAVAADVDPSTRPAERAPDRRRRSPAQAGLRQEDSPGARQATATLPAGRPVTRAAMTSATAYGGSVERGAQC